MRKLPPFLLVPEPMNDEARKLVPFKWAAEEVGRRHRLGGDPERLVSDADWPRCPACGLQMSFYGQLDSLNDEFCLADVGLIYVYVCFDCFQVAAQLDSP